MVKNKSSRFKEYQSELANIFANLFTLIFKIKLNRKFKKHLGDLPMRFSQAFSHFENGAIIARGRWNRDVKKDDLETLSFVYMQKSDDNCRMPQTLLDSGQFEDKEITVMTHPRKKNRANLHSSWLPTVEDLFAKDWYVVDFQRDWDQVCGQFKRREPVAETDQT